MLACLLTVFGDYGSLCDDCYSGVCSVCDHGYGLGENSYCVKSYRSTISAFLTIRIVVIVVPVGVIISVKIIIFIICLVKYRRRRRVTSMSNPLGSVSSYNPTPIANNCTTFNQAQLSAYPNYNNLSLSEFQ